MKCSYLPPPAHKSNVNSSLRCDNDSQRTRSSLPHRRESIAQLIVDTRLCGYDENRRNNGFTLVELSIVLVIIGLLTSGILLGKDLIRAAELRSITSEKDQIQTAVMLFRNKYLGLPGDLSNATDFWGTMPGTCSNTAAGASAGTGTQTCNGDGDGIMDTDVAFDSNAEFVLFRQHLSNAGLIEGQCTGIFTGWGNLGEFYVSKSGNNNWFHPNSMDNSFSGIVPITSTAMFEGGDYGNSLVFNQGTVTIANPYALVLTPSEAWGIDRKIDDGLPGVGKMVTRERNGVNCNTLAASAITPAASYSYNLSHEGIACELEFKNMW
jgi:prepilin-type N-terminal cleavage/methylation domain-containing protein